MRLAERVVALDPKDAWSHEVLGRALYRAGRNEEAVKSLEKTIEIFDRKGNIWQWFVLALAHHQLGHAYEARAWLGKAVTWLDQELAKPSSPSGGGSSLTWAQRLELQFHRIEAEALIQEGRPLYLPTDVFQGNAARAQPAPSVGR